MWWVKYVVFLLILLIIVWVIMLAKHESERMAKKWYLYSRHGLARLGWARQGKGVIRSLKNGIILKQM